MVAGTLPFSRPWISSRSEVSDVTLHRFAQHGIIEHYDHPILFPRVFLEPHPLDVIVLFDTEPCLSAILFLSSHPADRESVQGLQSGLPLPFSLRARTQFSSHSLRPRRTINHLTCREQLIQPVLSITTDEHSLEEKVECRQLWSHSLLLQ